MQTAVLERLAYSEAVATDYESKGRRFESCWGHHLRMKSDADCIALFVFAGGYAARTVTFAAKQKAAKKENGVQ